MARRVKPRKPQSYGHFECSVSIKIVLRQEAYGLPRRTLADFSTVIVMDLHLDLLVERWCCTLAISFHSPLTAQRTLNGR